MMPINTLTSLYSVGSMEFSSSYILKKSRAQRLQITKLLKFYTAVIDYFINNLPHYNIGLQCLFEQIIKNGKIKELVDIDVLTAK